MGSFIEYFKSMKHASKNNKGKKLKKLSHDRKKMYFCKKNAQMVENLSDEEILQALKRYDEKVTSEFFYDTCHIAYCIDDKKYGLRYKTGMDFHALAHEFYLRLCNNNWSQLEKRKPNISLANWTMNGFHFLVRERLNTYSQHFFEESIEERASKGKILFDAPMDNSQEEVKEMIEDICHSYYGSDRKAQSILRMILIMGMKGKEVASLIGITPAAVSQRYHTMMDQVVRPYFIKYYNQHSSYYEESMYDMESSPQSYSPSICPSTERHAKRSEIPNFSIGKSRHSLWDRLFGHLRKDGKDMAHEGPMSSGSPYSRTTPQSIQTLRENEIFVFGSDLRGAHCGGTAYQALRNFGAKLGQGAGPQGRCYAIPTIVGGLQNIRPYVDNFFNYAIAHPEQTFLVTPVGCGIAGFSPKDIAPLFKRAIGIENICLPQEFWEMIL